MKSIERLREWVPPAGSWTVKGEPQIRQIADEIEAEWQDSYDAMCLEIERDYMRLPVDADGVPIHVGDICMKLDERFEVRQLRTDGDAWWTIDRLGESYMANFCHHAKPRTLEDVLREFIAAYDEWDDNAVDDRMERRDELFAKYADEIRELMGGDER